MSNDNKQMLAVGTLLAGGKYKVERVLSSGGFGNAYVVRNVHFDEVYAMKEFFIKGVNNRLGDSRTISVSNEENTEQFESMRKKFHTEAVRLRKLNNPHIVKVHDLFNENGTSYYVMDLIDGESLSARLKRTNKALSEKEALRYFDQLLDALEAIHAVNIWHLDIKPGNLMIDKSGRLVLIDFGASKQFKDADGHSLSTTTGLCYTPGYAPLEQIEANTKRLGPWTDFYAVGASLYNQLTRKTPPSPSEILEDESVLEFPSSVSKPTQELIRWLMAYQRMQRPQSVAEIRAYLEPKQQPAPADDETINRKRKPKPAPNDSTEYHSKPAPVAEPEYIAPETPSWFSQNATTLKVMGGVALVAFLIFMIPVISFNSDRSSSSDDEYTVVEDSTAVEEHGDTAMDLRCNSPQLGSFTYNGPVNEDLQPDGQGVAYIKGGQRFEGEFSKGIARKGLLIQPDGTSYPVEADEKGNWK